MQKTLRTKQSLASTVDLADTKW